jgi:DNA-binding XRE family transcriptional regulator
MSDSKSMKQKVRDLLSKYGQNQNDLAQILGLTYQSVSIKLNGHKDFTQSEIYRIMVLYRLTPEEVVDIFFTREESRKIEITVDKSKIPQNLKGSQGVEVTA